MMPLPTDTANAWLPSTGIVTTIHNSDTHVRSIYGYETTLAPTASGSISGNLCTLLVSVGVHCYKVPGPAASKRCNNALYMG